MAIDLSRVAKETVQRLCPWKSPSKGLISNLENVINRSLLLSLLHFSLQKESILFCEKPPKSMGEFSCGWSLFLEGGWETLSLSLALTIYLFTPAARERR